jgi:O-antigen ligase
MVSALLLPIAHLKAIIFGIPIYSVEIPIIVASFAYVYGLWQGVFSPWRVINFRNPFVIGIALFFLGALLSFVINPFSWVGLGMLKTWFVFPIFALWLWLQTEPNDRDLRRLLLVWFSAVVLVASASLIYFFQGMLTYDGRLAGWYASPNYLAFFVAPGVLLASYFFSCLPLLRQKFFNSLLFALALIILGAVIFFTGSYTTWIGLFAALSLYFYLGYAASVSWRQKIIFAVLLIGIFSVFIFGEVGSEKWQAFVTLSARSSLASRLMIWRAAVSILYDHPLWGIGTGRFQEMYLAYQKYFPLYLEWAVPQPHNVYLAVWLQTGLLGLTGFIFLIIVWLKKMWILCRFSIQDALVQKTSALFIALMMLFLLLGVTDTPFFKTDLAFIFWWTLALGIGFLNQKRR